MYHDKLYIHIKESGYSTLKKADFTHALRYLIDKKFIQEEAAYYRLTSEGEDYVHALHQSSERVGWIVSLGLAIFLLVVTIQTCDSGAVHPSPATPHEPAVTTPVSTRDLSSGPFKIGDEIVVILDGTVRVRHSPGHLNKPTADAVCYTSAGERFSIVDGPQYVDGLWRKVSSKRRGEGWIAQRREGAKSSLAT